MGKWQAHSNAIRDAPAGLWLEAVKGLAAELKITIDEEGTKQLGGKNYVEDMILGGTHMDVAMIRHQLVNPSIKYNQGRCKFMPLQEGTLTPPIYRVLYCIIPKQKTVHHSLSTFTHPYQRASTAQLCALCFVCKLLHTHRK